MRRAIATINAACAAHRPAIAFSGGRDSNVLLHLAYTETEHRPPAIYVHNEIQNPLTLEYVQERCEALGSPLTVAQPDRTAAAQWQAQGYPILGPLPAANWMQRYKHLGVRINCSACCERMKIKPGRKATKAIGCDAQLTGIRATDDRQRFLRLQANGNSYEVDGLTIVHPLAHWTDTMVRRYLRQHGIPRDPSTAEGEISGCRCCAGAWRFDTNAIARLRRTNPAQWRQFIVTEGAWLPLLVVKYHQPADVIAAAVERMGGPEGFAERYPHVFDYAQTPPMRSYRKG